MTMADLSSEKAPSESPPAQSSRPPAGATLGSPSTAATPDPKTGVTVAELQNRIEIAQAVEGVEPRRKPFPWPILLVLLVPAAVGVTLALLWQEEMIHGLRVGWIALWSILPGFAVMATLGSLAQMRRRPILSFLAFVLGCGTVVFCWWAVKTITALNLLQ